MQNHSTKQSVQVRQAIQFMLSLVLVLATLPALSKSYLIVNFTNVNQGSAPTWLAIHNKKEFGSQGLISDYRRSAIHLPLKASENLLSFKSGPYNISHLDFTKRKGGNKKTLYFPKRFTMRFKLNTIYYLGDITFADGGMSIKPSAETIGRLCNQHAVLRSADALYVVFRQPKPIKIEAPCAKQ